MKLDSPEKLGTYMNYKDMYNGERQILKALPRMAQTASSPELRAAFEQHLEQPRGHVDRLEQIFQKLGEPAKGQKCNGIEGIITEGARLLQQTLQEEMETDKKLTTIADSYINEEAKSAR